MVKANSLLFLNTFKAPLSEKIKAEYNKLCTCILTVPDAYYYQNNIEGTAGTVSVSDLVAYQIGWGNLLLGWYTAGLKGKVPVMPGEGFTTWDYNGLAQHFYTKYQYATREQQAEKFYSVVQKIINIVEKEYATGNLDKTGVWSWCMLASGKQWPLSKWITVNTASPYRRASGLIKKFLIGVKK